MVKGTATVQTARSWSQLGSPLMVAATSCTSRRSARSTFTTLFSVVLVNGSPKPVHGQGAGTVRHRRLRGNMPIQH
jgi:hypothetical protein